MYSERAVNQRFGTFTLPVLDDAFLFPFQGCRFSDARAFDAHLARHTICPVRGGPAFWVFRDPVVQDFVVPAS